MLSGFTTLDKSHILKSYQNKLLYLELPGGCCGTTSFRLGESLFFNRKDLGGPSLGFLQGFRLSPRFSEALPLLLLRFNKGYNPKCLKLSSLSSPSHSLLIGVTISDNSIDLVSQAIGDLRSIFSSFPTFFPCTWYVVKSWQFLLQQISSVQFSHS